MRGGGERLTMIERQRERQRHASNTIHQGRVRGRERKRVTMTERQRERERHASNTSNQGRVRGGTKRLTMTERQREREAFIQYE